MERLLRPFCLVLAACCALAAAVRAEEEPPPYDVQFPEGVSSVDGVDKQGYRDLPAFYNALAGKVRSGAAWKPDFEENGQMAALLRQEFFGKGKHRAVFSGDPAKLAYVQIRHGDVTYIFVPPEMTFLR